MGLEHLWAGWRGEYVATVDTSSSACVFCGILGSGASDEDTFILERGETVFSIMNLYPYTSGHLMVMPLRHVGELEALTDDERDELWATVTPRSGSSLPRRLTPTVPLATSSSPTTST